MRSFVLIAAAVASLGTVPPPHPGPLPLPVNIGGRTIPDPQSGLTFGWPGVYFESRFRGTGVRVVLEGPSERLRLLLDGEERHVFRRPGRAELVLSGLPEGEHVVRLEKLSESQAGGGRFLGFYATEGGTPLPALRRARQIEFIGDSYTVGYGNVSTARECTPEEIHATTDTQQAFGPLVARRFDADYRIHAYSGFGIVRNYGGGAPALSLPIVYPRLKPHDAAQVETNDPLWRPQLIVINLGTNDFSTPLRPGEQWADQATLRSAYRRVYAGFVRSLSERHPQARFILMGSDAFFADVEQVAAELNARAPARVTGLRFGGLELTGCDWHPSLADNRQLAAQVISAAERVPGLWQ